ncbi:hypothetical protein MRX96_011248 [Rhipicephalus microplus]
MYTPEVQTSNTTVLARHVQEGSPKANDISGAPTKTTPCERTTVVAVCGRKTRPSPVIRTRPRLSLGVDQVDAFIFLPLVRTQTNRGTAVASFYSRRVLGCCHRRQPWRMRSRLSNCGRRALSAKVGYVGVGLVGARRLRIRTRRLPDTPVPCRRRRSSG